MASLLMETAVEKWKACGVTVEGEPIDVEGVNPWEFDWQAQGRAVELPHPSHLHQRHSLEVYDIDFGAKRITFAAGELSANVWGFYVPAATTNAPA